MKLAFVTRVQHALQSYQRTAGGIREGDVAVRQAARVDDPADAERELLPRNALDRRQMPDRRRAAQVSTVALMFDTRSKGSRRKQSRRSDDQGGLRNFKIRA